MNILSNGLFGTIYKYIMITEEKENNEFESQKELFNELVYQTSFDGLNKTDSTYEVKGGNSYEMTTGNAFYNQRQRINRTVRVTEELKIEVTVYNWDLEADMLTKEFESIDEFLSWDIETPHTDFIEPVEYVEYEGDMAVYDTMLDEQAKAQLTRKAQTVNDGHGVTVSCMVYYLVGRYAEGHYPARDKTPEQVDELTFKLDDPTDARYIGTVIPCVSVYEKAIVEVWTDGVDVTFKL